MLNKITYLSILFIVLLLVKAKAQYCTGDNRFTEEIYFANSDITLVTDLVYGNANDYEGNSQDLLMDIRYPSGANETFSKRPFILMIHGGGYTSGSKEDKTIASRVMARRGFVTAAINYRLGYDDTQPDDGLFQAAYRSQQDAFAALRYIIEHANTYGIDTNWIFIEGRSAGAGTALNCIFADQSEWETTVPGITAQWGSLNSSGNGLDHNFDIKGVTSDCGATSLMAIDSSDMVPMIMFHGEFDHLAPIDTAEGLAGSRFVYEQLVENRVCSELNVDLDGGHCPHPRDYRIQRTACFFKSIFCSACTSVQLTEEIPAACTGLTLETSGTNVKQQLIEIYPNPVSSQLTITGISEAQIQLLNAVGQVQTTIHTNQNLHTIDVSALPVGLYFLKVLSPDNNSFQIRKVVKQ